MKYIEYMKKLGIKTNDEKNDKKLKDFIMVQLREFKDKYLCTDIGDTIAVLFCKRNCIDIINFNLVNLVSVFEKEKDMKNIILYYSSFLYIIKYCTSGAHINQKTYDIMLFELESVLDQHKLNYRLLTDEDSIYLIPIKNTELDEKLIVETMEWLECYPNIRRLAIDVLQTYYDSEGDNISDVVDKFRKLLEQFMQAYFNSKSTLRSLISEYGNRLTEAGVSIEIANGFEKILNLYDMYNNNHAKHHKDAGEYDVEYVMYETFNIIRLLLQIEHK